MNLPPTSAISHHQKVTNITMSPASLSPIYYIWSMSHRQYITSGTCTWTEKWNDFDTKFWIGFFQMHQRVSRGRLFIRKLSTTKINKSKLPIILANAASNAGHKEPISEFEYISICENKSSGRNRLFYVYHIYSADFNVKLFLSYSAFKNLIV